MILYTCPRKDGGRLWFAHPCARAARALRRAGYEFEIKAMKGYRVFPRRWTSRDEDRAEVRELSGWNDVPIVLLDDGEVISGSRVIVRWAKENPAAKPQPARAPGGAW